MNRQLLFRLLLPFTLLLFSPLQAQTLQWELTTGPTGVKCFAVNGATIFAGTNAGVYRSIDKGESWTRASDGLGAVSTLATTGSTILAGTDGNGVYRSTNDGSSWIQVNGGLTNLHVHALAVCRTVVFAGTDECLFRSTDNGDSWTHLDTIWMSFVCPQRVFALAACGGTIFAAISSNGGFPSGSLFVSGGKGESWLYDHVSERDAEVTAIAANETMAFAAAPYGAGFLYRGTGGSWGRTGSLVFQNWGSYRDVIATSGTTVLVGTIGGLYHSTDNGDTWARANNGLADTSVWVVGVCGTMLFAEAGEGLYRADISGLQSDVAEHHTRSQSLSLSVQPNPSRDELRVSYNSGSAANPEIELYDLLGERVMNMHGDNRGVMKFSVTSLPDGMYMLRLRCGAATATRTVMIVR